MNIRNEDEILREGGTGLFSLSLYDCTHLKDLIYYVYICKLIIYWHSSLTSDAQQSE